MIIINAATNIAMEITNTKYFKRIEVCIFDSREDRKMTVAIKRVTSTSLFDWLLAVSD